MIGLTDDGAIANTVLTFMVQSLRSTYKDVKLVPVESLTTDIVKKNFDSVLEALAAIFVIFTV